MANVGIIPTQCPLYDDVVWGYVVPMGIPLLLLQCDIRRIWKEAGRMLTIFLIGAVGTVAGAFLAYYLLRVPFGDGYFCSRPIARATDTHMTPSRPQTLSASIRGWPSHISNSMLFPPKVVIIKQALGVLTGTCSPAGSAYGQRFPAVL